jgi:hypothetical protein
VRAAGRIALALLLSAASWEVWNRGGSLLEWLGLDELDPVGRLVLVFLFLTVCESALGWLRPAPRHPPTEAP